MEDLCVAEGEAGGGGVDVDDEWAHQEWMNEMTHFVPEVEEVEVLEGLEPAGVATRQLHSHENLDATAAGVPYQGHGLQAM